MDKAPNALDTVNARCYNSQPEQDMKSVHQIIFVAFLLLSAPGIVKSQINIPENSQIAPEKRIGAATATLLHHKGQDHVTVQTDPQQLQGDTTNGIVLIANFISRGKTVSAPAAVDLEFISYFSRRRFAVNRKIQILRDGSLFFTGTLTRNSSGRGLNGVITEVLTLKLPFAQYSQLLEENAATFALGGLQIEAGQQILAALRDLRKCIDTPVSFPQPR